VARGRRRADARPDEGHDGHGGSGSGGKGPIPLPRGVRFRSFQAGHDDNPREKGRGYLYFWPGGLTERASIQIHVGDSNADDDVLSLEVSPLTGKVHVKNGPVALVIPRDDKEASEREDNGAF
jgi:general secretion pathway protein H